VQPEGVAHRRCATRRGSTSSMCNHFVETHLRCVSTKWKGLRGNTFSMCNHSVVPQRGSTSSMCNHSVERDIFDVFPKEDVGVQPLFSEYHQLFYDGKRKRVPPELEKGLTTPLALAVWYLDDGGLRPDCKTFRLHTNNFSL
jgi:LAGLIDADG DNA endonuclease family